MLKFDTGTTIPRAVLLLLLAGCAGDPKTLPRRTPAEVFRDPEAEFSPGVKIELRHTNFFSLSNPIPNGNACAGDAHTYSHPLKLQTLNATQVASNVNPATYSGPDAYAEAIGFETAVPFAEDPLNFNISYRPPFLKNISVDLTDSNVQAEANRALSCSLATTPSSPKPSNCATFDYGAIGGIPTDMGGTLLLAGGVRGVNASGYNGSSGTGALSGPGLSCGTNAPNASTQCRSSAFALKIDALPSQAAGTDEAPGAPEGTNQSISMFTRLGSSTSSAAFQPVAGASAAYNPQLKRVLVFGGSSTNGSSGYDTDLTQVFDVTTQRWLDQTAPNKVISSAITTLLDSDGTTTTGLGKLPGSRALFGYAAVPWSALEAPTDDHLIKSNLGASNPGDLDSTDRIYIAGGIATTLGPIGRTYRFNPTFGPEIRDLGGSGGGPHHWIDSSPVTLLTNGDTETQLFLDLPSSQGGIGTDTTIYASNAQPSRMINFGLAPVFLRLNGNMNQVLGTVLMTAGFDYEWPKIGFGYSGADSTTHPTQFGQVRILAPLSFHRTNGEANPSGASLPQNVSQAGGVTNLRDSGARSHTLRWIKPQGFDAVNFPWLGGAALLNGPNLTSFRFFGGSTCQGYISDPTLVAADNCFSQLNSGRSFTVDTTNSSFSTTGANTPPTWTGSLPSRAGMATARADLGGAFYIVAVGGSNNTRFSSSASSTVHVLNTATNAWTAITPTGTVPPTLTNASLVYSHVTQRFYLFGGQVAGNPGEDSPRGQTWELTLLPLGGPPSSATWRQLNPSCYPNCPVARKSHRMVEVNYHNVNPDGAPVCTNPNSPCSFGLFMEGGSANQLETSLLGDRWMFDPTGNPSSSSSSPGPEGHWQRVDSTMPPRRFAALASYSYTLPFTGQAVHRALMFGGETALSNPAWAPTGHFVAPTLGDTQIYNFATNTWHRVRLLGQGIVGATPGTSGLNRFDLIQTYFLNGGTFSHWNHGTATGQVNPNLRYLSPPPLAGATMVTRLYPRPISASTANDPVRPLPVPEVFLFGGREKSGRFHSLGNVWKFCTASPGERPASDASDSNDFAQCDAYQEGSNEFSTSPTAEFTGRWLLKTPQGTNQNGDTEDLSAFNANNAVFRGAYLGAGTYDPVRDRIYLLGGLKPHQASATVTHGTHLTSSNTLLEYRPPSRTYSATAVTSANVLVNGHWREIPNCPRLDGDEPVARYGHSLSFDALNEQVVLVGGFRAIHLNSSQYQGQPLTQNVLLDNASLSIPEVYTGTYLAQAPAAGEPGFNEIDFGGSPSFPCMLWRRKSVFGNSPYIETKLPLEGSVAHAASTFIPSGGYNSGYYSLFDSACIGQGPVNSPDSSISKLLAGGVYLDLDRSRMRPNENLILNVTFLALGPEQRSPAGANFDASESAQLKVHLVRSGLSTEAIQSALQPRHLQYSSLEEFPQVVDTLAVLAPPASGLRQEQIVLPVSANPAIDRVRIERYSGSAILIDASLFRTQGPAAARGSP